jgi:sigma-E factor negative regulatory protein RseA
MKEKISALMDGEIDEREMQECLRELRNNPDHCCSWQQYHLIGDALRNNLPTTIKRDFILSVSQAVAKEELPAAVTPQIKTNSKSRPESDTHTKHRHGIASPWAGFALAASVAAVAYLGVGMFGVDEVGTLADNQATVPPVASTAPVMPMAAQPAGFTTVKGEQWNAAKPEQAAKLNPYLSSHRHVTGGQPINGVVVPRVELVVIKPESGE